LTQPRVVRLHPSDNVIIAIDPVEAKGTEFFEEILAAASGKLGKSELLGYGDNESVPWQIGAVM
jgi:altronate dehydratase